MRAIDALEVINCDGTDNSRYGIVRDWHERLTDESQGYSLSSLVCDLFGDSAEIMSRDYDKCWEVESVMYVYREEDEVIRLMDGVGLPIMAVYEHEFRQTIDLYEIV